MKIAVAQLTTSQQKTENLAKAQEIITKAKQGGADLVLLPETFMAFIPPNSGICYAEIAEPLDGPFVQGLAAAARQQGIFVVCGLYQSHPDDQRRAYNTTVVINRQGELIHHYQKTHLYDAFTYQESSNIIASDNPLQVIDTEFGKLGLLVCYELRFPEISRELALQGADLLLVPTAWVAGPMKEEHFISLVKARALENTLPVCAADQVGNIYAGRSVVFNPMGVALGSLGEEEGLIFSEIDHQQTRRIREKLPCLQHRRPQLYPSLKA